jgi:endonuclease/exonuclease/phosphatase family metal-dependent hydrolase
MVMIGTGVVTARLRLPLQSRPVLVQFVSQFLLVLLVACGFCALAALLLRKPILGLLAILGWGFPLAAAWLAHDMIWGFSRRLAIITGIACGIALLVVWYAAPFMPRPATVQFQESSPDDFTLLSWNIGLGQPLSYPSQREHLPAVCGVIRESQADIVCLQEVSGTEHLQLLLEGLGKEWHGHLAADGDRVPAVLTRLPATFRSPHQGLAFGGPASALVTTSRGQLEVLSLHMFPEQNAHNRETYGNWLAEYARSQAHPVLIAGDFNIDPEGWWDRVSPIFTDDLDRDLRLLTALRQLGHDCGQKASATSALSRRLEIIFVPRHLQCVEYRILHGKSQGRMDHWPIRVRLRLPAN